MSLSPTSAGIGQTRHESYPCYDARLRPDVAEVDFLVHFWALASSPVEARAAPRNSHNLYS